MSRFVLRHIDTQQERSILARSLREAIWLAGDLEEVIA